MNMKLGEITIHGDNNSNSIVIRVFGANVVSDYFGRLGLGRKSVGKEDFGLFT